MKYSVIKNDNDIKPIPISKQDFISKGIEILIDIIIENKRKKEEEKTKREEIKALRDVEIEKIKGIKKSFNKYTKKRFKERKKIIEKLDKMYEKEDDKDVKMKIIDSLTEIVKANPLEGFISFKRD